MSQIFKTTNQKQFSILLLVEEMWIHWHHGQRNLGLPSDLPLFLFGALPGDGFFIQHLMKQPELKASGHLPMGILWLLFPGIQLHVFTKLTLIIIYIVIVLFFADSEVNQWSCIQKYQEKHVSSFFARCCLIVHPLKHDDWEDTNPFVIFLFFRGDDTFVHC